MQRVSFLAPSLLAFFWLGAASAATFAGFTIKPTGDQKLDLKSGTTVLAQGGTATDAERGLSVKAGHIEYKDGAWLHAKNAILTTQDGGTLTAQKVEYTVDTDGLSASGDIKYNDKRVRDLTAQNISLSSKAGVVVASGQVASADPHMAADKVVVDYRGNRALMVGNYKYQYGRTKLSGNKPDATLLVTWNAQNQPSVTTKPSAAQLAPFQPYLK